MSSNKIHWVYNLNEVTGESCAAIKQEETANLTYIQSELFSILFHSLYIYLFIYLFFLRRCTINSYNENMILATLTLQKYYI